MNIVVDTNIFISALIKDSLTRKLIINSKHNLLFPKFELEEIEKYKPEIIRKSGLSKREFYILLLKLLNYVKIIPVKIIVKHRDRAKEIMDKIDPKDVIFIATALAFNAIIWSDDKHFKKQKVIKILTTKQVMQLFKEDKL